MELDSVERKVQTISALIDVKFRGVTRFYWSQFIKNTTRNSLVAAGRRFTQLGAAPAWTALHYKRALLCGLNYPGCQYIPHHFLFLAVVLWESLYKGFSYPPSRNTAISTHSSLCSHHIASSQQIEQERASLIRSTAALKELGF